MTNNTMNHLKISKTDSLALKGISIPNIDSKKSAIKCEIVYNMSQ